MVGKFDRLDLMILGELRENCKQSMRELARKLGSHPNTIMQRIKNLEKDGVIRGYKTVLNFDKLGYGIKALIAIQVEMNDKWEKALSAIQHIPEVEAFYAVTGESDALVIIRVKNTEDFANVLRKIQGGGFVKKTTSHLVVDTYKHPMEFNPLKVFLVK